MAGRYLICYDIADEKRLARMQRYVASFAVMVHYSVYLAELSDAELAEVVEGLRQRLHPNEDDVRIYTLTPRTRAEARGYDAAAIAALLNGGGMRMVGEED